MKRFKSFDKLRLLRKSRQRELVKSILVLSFLIILAFTCQYPSPPTNDEFVIYDRTLLNGFDIGLDDSQQKHDWLTDTGEFLRMSYPANLDWGCVYITTGMVAFSKVSEDFSAYHSFDVELRGVNGGEMVGICVEDVENPCYRDEYIFSLSTEWETHSFSLDSFCYPDLTHLKNVLKVTFIGQNPQTVDLRRLVYKKFPPKQTNGCEDFYVINDGLILFGKLGCNTSSGLTGWLSYENDYLKAHFPAKQKWATFFVKNSSPWDATPFDSISLTYKGKTGKEKIMISINDSLEFDPKKTKGIFRDVTNTEFKEFKFSLSSDFLDVNLSKICLPVQITSLEADSQIFFLKEVKYLCK